MKNFILLILIIFVFLFFYNISAAIVPGEIPVPGKEGFPTSPITEPGQLLSVIAAIAKYTYAIFLIVAVMFIIFAAFNYLTGGDEPEKIKTAHQHIKYAVIAIAVALIAVGASLIVKNFLLQEGGGAGGRSSAVVATATA